MARDELGVDSNKQSPPAVVPGEEGRLTGVSQHLSGRKVQIFMPAQSVMQSATYKTRVWKLKFDTKNTWVNPLMGWTSSSDTTSQLHDLAFETAESAVGFCERQGLAYEVIQPNKKKDFKGLKDYGDNFYTDTIKVGVRERGEKYFDHGENAHTSAWVNLKRTSFGGEQWTDNSWSKYRESVPKREDA